MAKDGGQRGDLSEFCNNLNGSKRAPPDIAPLHGTIRLPLFSRSKHISLQKTRKERAPYIFSLLGNKCQRRLSVIFLGAPSLSHFLAYAN